MRRRAFRPGRAGHPWIFRDDLVGPPSAEAGDVVRVVDESGESAGFAFWSRSSKIACRRIDGADDLPTPEHWHRVAAAAARHRGRVVARDTNAYRLVHGESDGIPGLVVDRYGDHWVAQTLTAGAARVLDDVLVGLASVEGEPGSVLLRNDPGVRALEGLPREVRQHRGATPRAIEVREGEVRYGVDPWTGQKTGAFLDQRENRVASAAYARGRFLDAFSYHGSFALHALGRAERVVALDSSAPALERASENAHRNDGSLETWRGNAFDALKAMRERGDRWDVIALDPPAFAKSRRDLASARRGYRELNARAMRLLDDGGILITSSCSYNLDEAGFLEVLSVAAEGARRTFRILEIRTQSRDHPIRLGFPESRYLKCLVLELT